MSSSLAKNRKEAEVAAPNRWGVNTARAGTAERQAISPLGDGWKPRVAPHYQAKVSEPERARSIGRREGGVGWGEEGGRKEMGVGAGTRSELLISAHQGSPVRRPRHAT